MSSDLAKQLFENTQFINLEHRADRLAHVTSELSKIDVTGTRFNAIKTTDGAIGCSMSHLKCLETAKKNEFPFAFICEDDIQFLDPPLFLQQLGKFCENIQLDWDVLIVSGNICPPYQAIDDYCVRLVNCQTTTGYIVQQQYYDTLIANIKEGIQLLLKNPANKREFAIDIYWKRLQAAGRWYMITPPTVVQLEGFSDVEKRNTNYKHLMTDMNKEWLFAQRSIMPAFTAATAPAVAPADLGIRHFHTASTANLPQQLNLGIKYRGSVNGKMNLQPSKK
jgi:GR25 family glycosyltransferase involved in LPS biosynthesis